MKRIAVLALVASATVNLAMAEMTATVNSDRSAKMSNGIITLEIDASGRVNKMFHPSEGNGQTNILGSTGIYFDYTADSNRQMSPGKAEIVKLTDDYAEILYSNTGSTSIRFSQGYILRAGESGVYTYVIAQGVNETGNASSTVKEARVCTRLAKTFLNGYVDEDMQGLIPSNAEMNLAESRQVMDATYILNDGSIYTKYQWAQFIDKDLVHGLANDNVGVWNIPVSYEWINGGAMRQELTVHATSKSPITIQMLEGEHLGGSAQNYTSADKHLFGPFFIYVNDGGTVADKIADAKAKALELRAQWPFQWFDNELYPKSRGTVSGKLKLPEDLSPEGYRMVLAGPGGNLISQGKNYQFWALTDAEGNFTIENVRPGEYSLYAYATKGSIIEEMERPDILVEAGVNDLGSVEWIPDRLEKEYFHIGEADRLSDGFKLSDRPRTYELYKEVPTSLDFTPGVSDETTDWWYALVNKGSWTVHFNLDEVPAEGARLWIAVAGVQGSTSVSAKINGGTVKGFSFKNDSSISRCANRAGRYGSGNVFIDPRRLKVGENTLNLSISNTNANGVIWDCIKLEGGATHWTAISEVIADKNVDAPYVLYNLSGVEMGTFDSLEDLPLVPGIYLYRHGAETGKVAL
ncbi:MAG: hypothetical protein K2K49_04335 [Duncaniella sp.]|nr:hypothetical protein [Duncaniella sp.]